MKKTAIIVALLAVVVVGFGLYGYVQKAISKDAPLACPVLITPAKLAEGIDLGIGFILENQLPEGNFVYEYDWLTKTYTEGDSSVRQAGTLWGLALAYRHTKDERIPAQLHKAFAFFDSHTKTRTDGAEYVLYPGEEKGSLGTVALVALAHIDYLATLPDITPEERARLEMNLKGYLQFITTAIRPDGLFAGNYDADGKSYGKPSPYYDGESLLALIKAARYAGYEEWQDDIIRAASAGHEVNVVQALEKDPDSDITKGYYQWSSMAYFELTQTGWENTDIYGEWLIELADWMIDDHLVLKRQRNTAYAFEGIISAYAHAKTQGDTAHERKFRCAIEEGLGKLMSFQVGASYANGFIAERFTGDKKAVGGVQNSASEAPLRIDVTQHQLHAMLLARNHLTD